MLWSYSLFLRGLFYEAICFKTSCVNLFLCFSVLLALRLPRFEKGVLIFVLLIYLFDLRLFGMSVTSYSWCLGMAAACDCGTPWTFLLPLF